MRTRVLSIEQARSQYLRVLAESKAPGSGVEQEAASRNLKRAVKALQQAQFTQRLRKLSRQGVSRPFDWNLEER